MLRMRKLDVQAGAASRLTYSFVAHFVAGLDVVPHVVMMKLREVFRESLDVFDFQQRAYNTDWNCSISGIIKKIHWME